MAALIIFYSTALGNHKVTLLCRCIQLRIPDLVSDSGFQADILISVSAVFKILYYGQLQSHCYWLQRNIQQVIFKGFFRYLEEAIFFVSRNHLLIPTLCIQPRDTKYDFVSTWKVLLCGHSHVLSGELQDPDGPLSKSVASLDTQNACPWKLQSTNGKHNRCT